MANKIQLRRGTKAQLTALGALAAGEPAYTTDTKELFVGNGTGANTLMGVANPWGDNTASTRSIVWASRGTAAQSINQNIWTTLILNNEGADNLGEYNPATGVFTPQKSGWYLIHGRATMLNVPVNTFLYLRVLQNGVSDNRIDSIVNTYDSPAECAVGGSVTVRLSAGESLVLQLYASLPVSVTTDASGSRFEIVQIA